jgi:hypothetical protein
MTNDTNDTVEVHAHLYQLSIARTKRRGTMVDLKKCKIMCSSPLVFSSFGWSRVEMY